MRGKEPQRGSVGVHREAEIRAFRGSADGGPSRSSFRVGTRVRSSAKARRCHFVRRSPGGTALAGRCALPSVRPREVPGWLLDARRSHWPRGGFCSSLLVPLPCRCRLRAGFSAGGTGLWEASPAACSEAPRAWDRRARLRCRGTDEQRGLTDRRA